MKDLPHHMKKLNRKVIRSSLRETTAETAQEPVLPRFQASEEEARKMEKRMMRDAARDRTPIHDSVDEKNRKMKHRVPIFDRNNAQPKQARPTKKKTPRI
jgi:hypothetical protein